MNTKLFIGLTLAAVLALSGCSQVSDVVNGNKGANTNTTSNSNTTAHDNLYDWNQC